MISSYLALVSHFLANDVPFFCSDCFIRVTWPSWQFISTVCCKDSLLSFTFLNPNLKRLTDAVWKFVVCVVLPLGSITGPLASVKFGVLEVVREDPAFITFVGDAASAT